MEEFNKDKFNDENLEISSQSADGLKAEDTKNFKSEPQKSDLNAENLSDYFVIGQDFFIDSTDADNMLLDAEKVKAKAKKKVAKSNSKGKGCLTSVIWMAAIFVIAIVAAVVIFFFFSDYMGISFSDDSAIEKEIVIEEGASAKDIADKLHDEGIINSTLFFRFFAKSGGYDSKFQNGVYLFCKQDSYDDIVKALTEQGMKANEVKITIPEGFTIDQIAERMQANGVCTADDFKIAVNEATKEKYNYKIMDLVKSQADGVHYILEGYLYPDTYYFYNTNDKKGAEMAIRKMLSAMDKHITVEMMLRAEELGYSTHDILTLASVIQMEASHAEYETKQEVSAVFHKRLKEWDTNAKLQSDPTCDYPYNTQKYDTYEIVGLAPGAYCSPSLDSINAALYPTEDSKYYYFVTDKDGKFYFNETLKAHNATIRDLKNKGKWYYKK